MKKRIIAIFMVMGLSLSLVACGEEKAEADITPEAEVDSAETEKEEVKEEAVEDTSVSDERRAEIFQAYLDELPKLDGKSFTMNMGYNDSNGLYPTIESDSGTIFWEYPTINHNLYTFNYEPSDNTLNVFSLDVGADEEITVVDSEKINDFIRISDDSKILFAGLTLSDNRDVLMIESRGLAYTYADGVSYSITLIEIHEDGTMDIIYDEGLDGSGDEDITEGIRGSYNQATAKNYSQEEFEDAFYNGNLIMEQENYPILASIKFRSDTADLADANDWDAVNEITYQIYGDDSFATSGKTIHWGTGSFSK